VKIIIIIMSEKDAIFSFIAYSVMLNIHNQTKRKTSNDFDVQKYGNITQTSKWKMREQTGTLKAKIISLGSRQQHRRNK